MARRVVIGVGIAAHPLRAAGNTWAFLQWVLGFRQAGWDVWMVEAPRCDQWIDPHGRACAPALSANRQHWCEIVSEFQLEERATLFLAEDAPVSAELLAFARDADLFLNISGHFRRRDLLAAPRCRVYLDLDPAFTQIWAECYGVEMNLAGHDHFLTVGRLLGQPGCRAPTAGRIWKPVGIPIVLNHFENAHLESPGQVWTTFTHWSGYAPVEYRNAWYGNKSEEFAKIRILPQQTTERLEIASDLNDDDPVLHQFRAAGWSMISAGPFNTPWTRYRAYAEQSRGEFCVAKNGYVRARCGWFSDRSAMYLALGRPVILQETGWSEFYPTGAGLHTFSNLAGAVAALEKAARDPAGEARAARAIAEKYFAAPRVIQAALETIGLRGA